MSGGGLWAEIAQSKCENVTGRRPHTLFIFLLRDLGPETPSGHDFSIFLFFYLLAWLVEWTTTGSLGLAGFCCGSGSQTWQQPICFHVTDCTSPSWIDRFASYVSFPLRHVGADGIHGTVCGTRNP